VRIRVEAAGVSFATQLVVAGKYQRKPPLPFTPGTEVAGTVIESAPDLPDPLPPGTRVFAVLDWGGMAEEAIADAIHVVPVPEGLPLEPAVAMPISYPTAASALIWRARLEAEQWVLVHGAAAGGWFWAPVAERLRAQGHRAFTPTLTGMGERRHLLSREVTLDTWVEDIVNLVEFGDLRDLVLVGHSFGGIPITGVADRVPDRIRRLVYLDAIVPQPGRSVLDALPPEVAAARRRAAQENGGALPPLPAGALVSVMGVPAGPVADWLARRGTPHPFSTYEGRLELKHPVGNGRPRTYVFFTSPPFAGTEQSRRWVRAQDGWDWAELAAGHVAPATAPEEVTRLLAGLG